MKQITVVFLAGLAAMFISACDLFDDDDAALLPENPIDDPIDDPIEDPITGTLDSTFGTDGIVVHDDPVSDSTGKDMILDGSGNIYAVGDGIYSNTDFNEMVIWKYNGTGILDSTFGTNGVAANGLTAPSATGDYGTSRGYSIDMDASGDIYVTGHIFTAATGSFDIAIWKFDSTGAPDSTFGTGGVVIHEDAAGGTSGYDESWGIVVDGSGDIYVSGFGTNSAGDWDMVILKYDGTGTLDNTFGTNGVIVSDGAAGGTNSRDGGGRIALDGSGNIFTVGFGENADGDYDLVIWKFDSTGTPDSTFGTGGVVVGDGARGIPNEAEDFYAIAIDSSGNIFAAGNSGEYTGSFTGDKDMVIWKFDSTGTPDSTFGTGGVVVHADAAAGADIDTAHAIQLDASGNIYAAGYSANSAGNNDMVIWKFDSTGTLDNTFASGGVVVSGGVAGNDNADDVAWQIRLDGSGNLYAVGASSQSGQNSDVMVIWNYN